MIHVHWHTQLSEICLEKWSEMNSSLISEVLIHKNLWNITGIRQNWINYRIPEKESTRGTRTKIYSLIIINPTQRCIDGHWTIPVLRWNDKNKMEELVICMHLCKCHRKPSWIPVSYRAWEGVKINIELSAVRDFFHCIHILYWITGFIGIFHIFYVICMTTWRFFIIHIII